MKFALIQMHVTANRAQNLATAQVLVNQAVMLEKPDWIMLPELFEFAGGSRETKLAVAEPFPQSAAYRLCQNLAAEHKIFIHAGSMMERADTALDGARIFNTTVVFDRAGAEVARYRKIHLFDVTTPDGAVYQESATFQAGNAVVAYDCEGVTIGCAICYDLRFPDLFQALRLKKAEVLAVPAAFTLQTGRDHWEVLLRARAIETQCFVCASAQYGAFATEDGTRHTYGHSLIADPWGHVIAKASDGVGFIACRLDMALVRRARTMIPVMKHRVQLTAANMP